MINATIRDLFGINTQQWMSAALCAQSDAETFYPKIGQSTQAAKKICATCPVKVQCLEYAITHDERFGVWGGLSERERRRYRRGEYRPRTRCPNDHDLGAAGVDRDAGAGNVSVIMRGVTTNGAGIVRLCPATTRSTAPAPCM